MPDRHTRRQVEFYRRKAARFDRSVMSLGCRDNRNHRVKIASIARAIGALEGGGVLEVGTGTGLHARWLLENTPVRYTGVDLSEQMLGVAARRLAGAGRSAPIGAADALRLPFAAETFDAAFCSGTLHHLSDPSAGIRELARVTKPGGRVAAMEPNWKFPSTLLLAAFVAEERNAFKIDAARLARWARDAGLTEVRVDRLLYTPPRPARMADAFDRWDRRLARVPGIRALSIMLLVAGTHR